MRAPQITPFVVDQSRLGGKGATQRHGFNQLSAPRWKADPRKEAARPSGSGQLIQPPPMRLGDLGYGLMEAPEPSESQIKAVQAAVAPVVEALQAEIEVSKLEANAVSPESIRNNPDAYKTLNDLAPYFSPQEMRSQIVIDAKNIQAEASRLLSGAVGSYLTTPQAALLETVVDDAKKLVAYVQQFDLAPITGAKSKLAEDHAKERLDAVRQDLAEAEKLIVSQEAGSVPVFESGEKILGTILVLGILGAITWVVIDNI